MNVPTVPVPAISQNREAQYTKRIKELEEELRLMKVENDKNVRHHSFINFSNFDSIPETYDCEIPGAMGEIKGFCQEEKRSKSSSRGRFYWYSRTNCGGARG